MPPSRGAAPPTPAAAAPSVPKKKDNKKAPVPPPGAAVADAGQAAPAPVVPKKKGRGKKKAAPAPPAAAAATAAPQVPTKRHPSVEGLPLPVAAAATAAPQVPRNPPPVPMKRQPSVDRGAPPVPTKRKAAPPVPASNYSNVLMDGSATMDDLRAMLREAEAKLQSADTERHERAMSDARRKAEEANQRTQFSMAALEAEQRQAFASILTKTWFTGAFPTDACAYSATEEAMKAQASQQELEAERFDRDSAIARAQEDATRREERK